MKSYLSLLLCLWAAAALAADLSGHRLLVTSVRTGDTEVFIADPTTGDMLNLSRSPKSEDRYPCWSPDAKRVCFMSDRENSTNKRPVWVIRPDGSEATLLEPLRFQMAIDGSRASWRPMAR